MTLSVESESDEARSVGRPRNPQIDGRVRQAAVHVYAEEGWANFYFDRVAREAGVGKSAIYRRWASREDLLIDAIHPVDTEVMLREAATLEDALTRILDYSLQWWSTGPGRAYIRLQIDQVAHPFLRKLYQERVTGRLLSALSEIVESAVASGELPSGSSPTLMFECMTGAAMNRMVSQSRPPKNNDRYIKELVSFVIGGAVASAATGQQ